MLCPGSIFIIKYRFEKEWPLILKLLEEQSDQCPHCLPVCKNRFEKFTRIFRTRHKQTTFSDAGFPGILRVKNNEHALKTEKAKLSSFLI